MSKLTRWIDRTSRQARARIANLRRARRILVIHIAKTAGTSLRHMLEIEYGPKRVYPGDFYLDRLPNGLYPEGSEMLRTYREIPPHNVLIGHFTAALADMLPKHYRTATMLREPIQRSLSMLSHFSRMLNVPVPALLDDEAFMSRHVTDYQTSMLGAHGVCDPHELTVADDHALARALGRLDTLDFIGLTERFEDACLLFDERFHTHLCRFTRRDNVLRPEGTELSEHIPRIEPFVQRDQALYAAAVKRFDADCRALKARGRSPAHRAT